MIKLLITAGLCFFYSFLSAQGSPSDSTRYVFGLPITEEGDSVPAGDAGPPDVYIVIPTSQIPKKLLKALNKDELYHGWEKLPIYQQKNTKHYIVRIADRNTVRSYGFNEDGNVVTYDEFTRKDSLQN